MTSPRKVTSGLGGTRWACDTCGASYEARSVAVGCCYHTLPPELRPVTASAPRPLTGGASDYYKVEVRLPTSGGHPYMAECNDIIEALGMTYAEGNVLKAVWRLAAGRQGNGKAGSTPLYESEKVEYFGKRLVALASGK